MAIQPPTRTASYEIGCDPRDGFAELLHAAALARTAWPALLTRVAEVIDAVGAAVLVLVRTAEDTVVLWGVRPGWLVTPAVRSAVARRLARRPPRGDVLDLLGDECVDHAVALATLEKGEHTTAVLVLERGVGTGSFTTTKLRQAVALADDLRLAFAAVRRIEALVRERDALAAVLDRVPVGLALLDRDGRIAHLNAAARTMTTDRDGLTVTHGMLAAPWDADTTRLRRAVRQITSGTAPIEPLPVARRGAGAPYFVRLTPLPTTGLGDDLPAAVALLADPDGDVAALAPMLRTSFDLTPTEADVTLRLLAGARVETIASDLGVSANTVRTHLKRTFSKVGVTSQSELVRVLARGAAVVGMDREGRVRASGV